MKHDRPGVALMLVLWLVVVLGAVAAAVVALSRADANVVVAYRSRAVARAAAESGADAMVVRLRGTYGGPGSPEERLRALPRLERELAREGPRALGQGRFQVALEDLSGRLAINAVDYPTLIRFFTLTAGSDRAERLAAAVLDWKDEDDSTRPDGAEAAEYEAVGSPYRPLNRPFQRIEEVPRLLGVDDSLAAVLRRTLTVYGGGPVNVNTAPAEVVAAVTGLDPAVARRLVSARELEPFLSLDALRTATGRESGAAGLSLAPTRLRIVSRGWAEGRPYTREVRVVVELRGWGGEGGPEIVVVGRDARDL